MGKHLVPWKRSEKRYKTCCQKVKHRLGPNQGWSHMSSLSLSLTPFTLRVSPGSCQGWTRAVSSFFLELFLHWSPVACWAPANLGGSSFSIISFCLFVLFMGFSRQEYWSVLPFPSPVGHVLSELSTMICPSWVALHGTTHSFNELDKAVVHVISLVHFLWLWFSFCLPSDG